MSYRSSPLIFCMPLVGNNEERIADLFSILAHGLALNVIDLKYGALLLAHYSEHGDYAEATVDSPIKVFVDELETNLIRNGTLADQICDLYMVTLKKVTWMKSSDDDG